MTPKIHIVESSESQSVVLWNEAASRVAACSPEVDNILFIARDGGSLFGLRRYHGKPTYIGFYAITTDKLSVLDGMRFRFAYLIDPSDELLETVKAIVTEQITIARRKGALNAAPAS